jgi:phenylacetate-coenzyme A ligase PaaK-like adenylate-forming protein
MLLTTDDNHVDQLTVEVESKSLLSQIEQIALEKKLIDDIKSVIVFNPNVTVLPPNSIAQEGLKAKRVVDNRKKE